MSREKRQWLMVGTVLYYMFIFWGVIKEILSA